MAEPSLQSRQRCLWGNSRILNNALQKRKRCKLAKRTVVYAPLTLTSCLRSKFSLTVTDVHRKQLLWMTEELLLFRGEEKLHHNILPDQKHLPGDGNIFVDVNIQVMSSPKGLPQDVTHW